MSLRYLKLMNTNTDISKKDSGKIKVYYDGLCHLCSREIDLYRKNKNQEKFSFVDITDTKFDAKLEGLNPIEVHKALHIRTQNGQVLTGVEAFIEMWKHLDGYNWLSKMAQISWVQPVLKIGYFCFARIRPILPKKKKDCDTSPYCES